jgi:hypothetical protein
MYGREYCVNLPLDFINKRVYVQDKVTVDSGSGNGTTTYSETQVAGDALFANLGLSMIKTLVMFVGEMNYSDLQANNKKINSLLYHMYRRICTYT